MIRYAMAQVLEPADRQPVFSLFALIFISVLLTERDCFNQLEVDEEFLTRLL